MSNGYCKFCGGTILRKIPVVRQTKDITKKEIIGSIPNLMGKFSKTKDNKLEYSIQEICCETCLNYNVHTIKKPLTIEMTNGKQQNVIIPETMINVLKQSSIAIIEIENGISSAKSKLDKIYSKYIKNGGRNTCKNYKIGEEIIFSLPYLDPFPCWVIIDFIDSILHFHLTFGGKEIHCR